MSFWHYLQTVGLATDDFVNAVTGGEPAPSPQGTISLRAAVAKHYDHGYKHALGFGICAFLNLFQEGHCERVLTEALTEGQRL